MKKSISLLLLLFTGCLLSINLTFAQTSSISLPRSTISTASANIKHAPATYIPQEGISLNFQKIEVTYEEKKELETGYFVVHANIVLTDVECKELKAPKGTTIKAGKYPVIKKGGAYIVPLRSDK